MAQQNIYDNETFFAGYRRLRENEANANVLFEMPALFSMLPDLHGMKVLDLGCGFGEHCMEYVRRGAEKVTGIDISEKMLEAARRENSDERIEYIRMPMEELDRLEGTYDTVVSSLAMHYVEDFAGVVGSIYRLMSDGGTFVYSQENPLCTCYSGGDRWTRDESGHKLYINLSDYCVEGERSMEWFVDGVKTYHRMFSTVLNTLTAAGFTVEHMIEPTCDDDIVSRYPHFADLRHKPDFLVVRAVKRV